MDVTIHKARTVESVTIDNASFNKEVAEGMTEKEFVKLFKKTTVFAGENQEERLRMAYKILTEKPKEENAKE